MKKQDVELDLKIIDQILDKSKNQIETTLSSKLRNSIKLEIKIDRLDYYFYNLTEEEIQIIEKSI